MVQPIQGLYQELQYSIICFLQSLKNLKYFFKRIYSTLFFRVDSALYIIFHYDNHKLSIPDLSEPLSNSAA